MTAKQGFKSLRPEDMEKALRRAAQDARELARLHGTPLVLWQDGKIVEEYQSPTSSKPTPEPATETP